MPAGGGAPANDPMAALLQGAAQAVQSQDCQMAIQVCQMLMEMAGGGQQQAAPAEGEPVYRRGGRLVKRLF